jgi:hypothetical protein
VVDQLEELFTTGFSPEVRQKYTSAAPEAGRTQRISPEIAKPSH